MKIGIAAAFSAEGINYEKLHGYGFDCVDFGMADTDTIIYTLPVNESDLLMQRERENAQKAGMTICQVHGPWRYPPKDFEESDRIERLEKMKRSIRATAMLGCKYWVVHPIMPFTTHDIEHGKEKETRELNLSFLRNLLPTAKEYGVTICLENMPMLAFSLAKPEDILGIVEEINDENLQICLDTGHVSVFKELSIGDEVRRLGDRIKILHVHDNRASIDMHLFPYFGKLDWNGFLSALSDIEYKGVLSLETEPPSSLSPRVRDMMFTALAEMAKDMVEKI